MIHCRNQKIGGDIDGRNTVQTVRTSNDSETLNKFIEYMSSEVSKTLDKPRTKTLIESEKENRKEFEERYNDVLVESPISDADRIQYFAGVMLNFLSSIFHGKWTDRFNAYIDFSEFYLSKFDPAYSQFHNKHQKYEKAVLYCLLSGISHPAKNTLFPSVAKVLRCPCWGVKNNFGKG